MRINFITIIVLIIPFCLCGQVQKPARTYADNPTYIEQTDYYSLFHGDHQIVMLGNSLTQRMHWDELLSGYDVVNRGIGSDVSAGMLNRTRAVINCHPKIVFIECGVNDIAQNVPYNQFKTNLGLLLNIFKSNKISVVLFNIIHTTEKYPDAVAFNQTVNLFNRGIDSIATAKSIKLIDLNKHLTNGNYLNFAYAEKDGIHLQAKAYIFWRDEVLKYLAAKRIGPAKKR